MKNPRFDKPYRVMKETAEKKCCGKKSCVCLDKNGFRNGFCTKKPHFDHLNDKNDKP